MAKTTAKIPIKIDSCETVMAHAPVIVSASRSTDIPAFYSDWFFDRLQKGYSAWTNPFNNQKLYISYENVKFIVFWSKNPEPLLDHLDSLKSKGIGCYIQYTLNDYEADGLEKGVPDLDKRIVTFKTLVDKLGKGRVIWRFDPLVLTDNIDMDSLLIKIENIGDQLQGYTEKLVFSYADIISYRKVKSNLEKSGINYVDWTEEMMREFAMRLSALNKKWGYELATCGERIDLKEYSIQKNHCIDDRLIVRFGYKIPELMEYLGAEILPPLQLKLPFFDEDKVNDALKDTFQLDNGQYAVIRSNNSDKGQREACGCMKSKDIGQYNTCPHLCEYCYANSTKDAAVANWRRHLQNPFSETITG